MRHLLAVAALMLFLVGCAGSRPTSPSPATSAWRVVPLHPRENTPDPSAILVNEQTRDTWIYISDSWHSRKWK